MKKLFVVNVAVLSTLLAVQALKADVIAGWTFQTSASTNNIIGASLSPAATQSGVLADIGTGTANASHALPASVWSMPAGNGSTNSWSANTWSLNDYFQFNVSTLGFTGVSISFDMARSGTGPGQFQLNYSTDGVNFALVAPINVLTNGGASGLPSWNSSTGNAGYTFTFAPGIFDNSAIADFQLQDVTATGAAGGTVRVDNFIVTGISSVPEPSSISLAALGGGACLLAFRRKR